MESPETPDGPSIAPVRPAMVGRGLPLPPRILTVSLLSLAAGLAAGFALSRAPTGPEPTSPPTPSAPETTQVSHASDYVPWPTYVIYDPNGAAPAVDSAPAGGISLARALDELEAGALGSRDDVVSARIMRLSEIPALTDATTDRWVWALTVRGSYINACGGWRFLPPEDPSAAPALSFPTYSPCSASSEIVVFDYETGEFVEAMSPAPF